MRCLLLSLLLPIAAYSAQFQNLDFESSQVQPTAPGTFGTYEPIEIAMPGWRAFLGSTEVTRVLHNSFTLGEASVDLMGPSFANAIEGDFDVLLQPGGSPYSQENIGVSIEQTGLLASEHSYLLLKARYSGAASGPANHFGAFINGQRIELEIIYTGAGYSTYLGNVSLYRNQEITLNLAAFYLPDGNAVWLDSIEFSPIPEPGTWALLLGSALCAPFLFRRGAKKG